MAQYFPKIPTRVYVTGNIPAGQRYIGYGRQRLDILFRSLELSGLPHGFNTRELSDGTIIKTTINYGISSIQINSPTSQVGIIEPTGEIVSPLYYYRITNDGYIKLSYSGFVEDFATDRIIVWDIAIDDEGNLDTGKGAVVLDVDVLKQIVYPEDIERTEEEVAVLIARAESYIDGIDTGKSPENMADTWMTSGEMWAPFDAYQRCGGTAIAHEITLYDGYEGYYHMTTPYKVGTNWENDWCPASGGVTDHIYTSHEWLSLVENNHFYGENGLFSYGNEHISWDDYVFQTCHEHPNGSRTLALICGNGTVEMGLSRGLKAGWYFTKNDEDTGKNFPCFFVSEFSRVGGADVQYAGETAEGDIAFYDSVHFSTESLHHSGFGGDSSELQTPVEVVTPNEFMADATVGNIPCIESGCHEDYAVFGITNNDDGSGNPLWQRYLPCDAHVDNPVYGNIVPGGLTSEKVEYDSSLFSRLFMFDGVEKIVSLSATVESAFSKKSFHTLYPFSTRYHWHCGVFYLYTNDVPIYEGQKIGVVIYIFNPGSYWEIDPNTDEETNFWDIHSEREDEGVINSNRALELEEYVNDVLCTYKDLATENRDDLEQYSEDFDSNYTLNSLEFILSDGILEDKKELIA